MQLGARTAQVVRLGSRGLGRQARTTWGSRGQARTAWGLSGPSRATQAAKLMWPGVRRSLGGSDFFWLLFFVFIFFSFSFFPSGSDFFFAGAVVLLYMGL